MKEALSSYFSNVSDPRSLRKQHHPFMTIIGTSFLSVLSGIDSFSGMQLFAEAHLEELEKYFDFPSGAPSHDTFQRFWDSISPNEFLDAFYLFTQNIEKISGDIISIDGKNIRNSGKNKSLHIVSAWCQVNQLVLAQEKVDEKSNEITAIPQLLKLLDLRDRIVTIDAMGAQRDICEQITGQLGDYVICLKGNQGTLHEDVRLYLEDQEHHEERNENNDKGHGRLEQRTAVISHSIGWLQSEHSWPGLKTIGMVHARVNKKDKETSETRFYISSLELSAQQLNDIARRHWGIENQLHWRLDVVFNEDKACVRNDNAAENMDIMRKWALNSMGKVKEKPDQSIKGIMRKNSMSFKYLISNVKKIFHA
jgi:predicted transposase YbfD/YdcC